MTEFDEQKKQREIIAANAARLATQLYDGGLPGINTFAMEVVASNFTSEELLQESVAYSPLTKRKMAMVKPIFTVAVGEAILDACAGVPTHHGEEVLENMRKSYTGMMTALIKGLKESANNPPQA